MAYRKKLSRRSNSRKFRKGIRVHKKNLYRTQMRGGYRL